MDMSAVQCMCVLCLCVLYDLCTVLYALVIVLLVCAVFGHTTCVLLDNRYVLCLLWYDTLLY